MNHPRFVGVIKGIISGEKSVDESGIGNGGFPRTADDRGLLQIREAGESFKNDIGTGALGSG